MITLGIETSCDETALALIETRTSNGIFECRVISSLVNSQAELHSAFGGVFPTVAKREHSKNILPLLKNLLAESPEIADSASNLARNTEERKQCLTDREFADILAGFTPEMAAQNADLLASFNADSEFLKNIPNIDRIAVTEGPGLEPALWVGIIFGEILSALWSKPLVPVNHMEGHIMGSLLRSDAPHGEWQSLQKLAFPAIALLISGGHTELVHIDDEKSKNGLALHYTILGQTKDDAVGEAFDKVARLLDLKYPGGPHISKLSAEAVAENISSTVKLPRPMLQSGDLNFSFSGLKTAVMYAVKHEREAGGGLSETFKKGLAREFEEAVKESLDAKLRSAIDQIGAKAIIIGGGVSANKTLRKAFEATAAEYGVPLYLPSAHISGDNALMIALAGALDDRAHADQLRAQGTKKL